MLFRCRLAGFGAHPRGEQAACGFPVQNRGEQSGAARLRRPNTASLAAFLTCRSCVTASTSPSDFALARVDGLAGQHQRHRLHRIDQCVKRTVPPRPGMQAEHHLRENQIAHRRSQSASGRQGPLRGRRRDQKPWITATVGTRSASSRSITAWARPIAVSTASGSVARETR
jgi:hypothetical protein